MTSNSRTEETMAQTDDPNSVRKSVTVKVQPPAAWRVFTEQLGTWWPLATYKIGAAKAVDAVIEPSVGGRSSAARTGAPVTGVGCSSGSRPRI